MAATCDCLATAWRSEVSPTRGPSRECQLGRAKTPLRPGTRRSYTDGRWSRPGMPPAGRSLAWPAGRGCRPGGRAGEGPGRADRDCPPRAGVLITSPHAATRKSRSSPSRATCAAARDRWAATARDPCGIPRRHATSLLLPMIPSTSTSHATIPRRGT